MCVFLCGKWGWLSMWFLANQLLVKLRTPLSKLSCAASKHINWCYDKSVMEKILYVITTILKKQTFVIFFKQNITVIKTYYPWKGLSIVTHTYTDCTTAEPQLVVTICHRFLEEKNLTETHMDTV